MDEEISRLKSQLREKNEYIAQLELQLKEKTAKLNRYLLIGNKSLDNSNYCYTCSERGVNNQCSECPHDFCDQCFNIDHNKCDNANN